jgi:cytoskeletal protein CcmA (bactofilin family)
VVFRRDSKVDAFQRQISALRHQLGSDADDYPEADRGPLRPLATVASPRSDLPELDAIMSGPGRLTPDFALPTDYGREPPDVPPVPAIDAQTSVLAATTTWNGELESTGSLHIHGRVEGTLAAREDIFIAEEAEVDATIHATNVTIAGNVRGSVSCGAKLEVLPRGRVAGDLCAPIIVVHEGALVAGEIVMASPSDAKGLPPAAPRMRAARGGD